jgi:3-phenylpropionate/trans-cinnamate dioxygenase ferredoxin reductase component
MVENVLILGAGQAGGRFAETLRERGFGGEIVLAGEEAEPPYERPPLSKEILAGTMPESGALLHGGAAFWAERGVTFRGGMRAVAIDRAAKHALFASGEALPYDTLVLATGCTARRLPALAGAPSFALRDLGDARALRARLTPGATLLCIGGGVIGLEVAATARGLGCRAIVVEAGPRLMGRSAPPVFAEALLALHRARGVELHLGRTLAEMREEAGKLHATLDDGTRIAADVAVEGIGATPNESLAREAGLEVRDGIFVDARGRTSDPAILAVGDVARHPLARFGITLRQETWRHADNHPRAVAAALLDASAPDYDDVPGFWSDQHGTRLMIEGICEGEMVLRGDPHAERFSAFWLQDGALRGAGTLGDSRAMAVARRLIAAGVRPDPSLLADPAKELRALLR